MELIYERMKSETFRGMTLNDIVGGGEPKQVSENTREVLVRHANLRPGLRVLEIGCGCGRGALSLIPEVQDEGMYYGLDMIPDLIDFCRHEITSCYKNFNFFAVKDNNPLYDNLVRDKLTHLFIDDNELDKLNGTVDLVMAFSVFTHLQQREASAMLQTVYKRLAWGGTAVLSFFILDHFSRQAIRDGYTDRFQNMKGSEIGKIVSDNTDGSNSAIGYDLELLSEMLHLEGFDGIYGLQFGSWRCSPGLDYQDIVILKKTEPLPVEFDPALYFQLNPDLVKSGMNPYSHFINWGRKEGRPWRISDK